MSGKTVLVLGAGASLAYGLPLGKGLLEKICELLPQNDKNQMNASAMVLYDALSNDDKLLNSWRSVSRKDFSHALIDFRSRLIESDPKSIDEFLSRDFGAANDVYRAIGKLCIAHVIAAQESASEVLNAASNSKIDDWYRYLWQDCLNANCKSLDDVKAKKLQIVSFNYDRSLEYFLGRRLAATYLAVPGTVLASDSDAAWCRSGFSTVENDFEITHPYGTLGLLSAVPYGHANNSKHYVSQMAANIKVIGEERGSDDGFAKAKDWLSDAQRVVFLGFSYDRVNMERLGLDNGLGKRIGNGEGIISRDIFALTFGMERAERISLINKYFSDFSLPNSPYVEPGDDASAVSEAHQTMQITQYLRRYGGLTQI